jgi:hypothetical protein
MTEEAKERWTKQVMGLVHVIEKSRLPEPIALHWDPYDRRLTVQVEEQAFRPWLASVASPVLESTPHDEMVHVSATGELDRCRMVRIRLVAVCHPTRAVSR